MMRILRGILIICTATLLGGCAGYRLGPSNGLAAGEKSVQLAPFSNQTLEPRLGDAVSAALRKEVQRDGTYRLATHDDGDIVVTGTVTHYQRTERTLVPTDLATARDYRLDMTAQVTARDRVTGKVLVDQLVKGSTLMRVTADLTSAERQALPLVAADLAKHVTMLLADGSW